MLNAKLTLSKDPAAAFKSLTEGLNAGIKKAMEATAQQVAEDSAKAVIKKASRAVDATIQHFDELHDTALEDALYQYLRSIDATITKMPDQIQVKVGVEALVTPSAWSLPWLLKLLEYGGVAFIGGRTVPVPPYPHWRPALDMIRRNVKKYGKAAEAIVRKEILARLTK